MKHLFKLLERKKSKPNQAAELFKTGMFTIAAVMMVFLNACERDRDNPRKPGKGHQADHGFITKVELILESPNGQQQQTIVFSDPDGPGGLPPIRIDTLFLPQNSQWKGQLRLYDESTSGQSKDITYQIEKSAADHIVCYFTNGVPDGLVNIRRVDSDGRFELGLQTEWNIGPSTAEGQLRILLKHQVRQKDGTCLPGSTDVDIIMPLWIQ
jgi:hypothetical protein